jgi:hypothetical protein
MSMIRKAIDESFNKRRASPNVHFVCINSCANGHWWTRRNSIVNKAMACLSLFGRKIQNYRQSIVLGAAYNRNPSQEPLFRVLLLI